MKKPLITFENFSFQYKAQKTPTLKNINLTLYEGEKVLIVGASGSGKSSLGHCINGLAPFFYKGEIKGRLSIHHQEAKTMTIFERSNQVGTVLQDPDSQFIGLTVGEDIAFKLENECENQKVMQEKVWEAACKVGIEKHLGTSPNRLSGGQKQRVSLAGVMVRELDILLFDEPLASLDPHTGKQAMTLIDDLCTQTNKTMIIIEHRLEDVLHANIDRIIVMREGEIVADYPPNKLLTTPILEEEGIREPLYITAMKYAGCTLTDTMPLDHVDKLPIEAIQEPLQKWVLPTPQSPQAYTPLLQFENVGFAYESGKNVLKDVHFTIGKGEMMSIIGKNGAGKSTLSKLISGFYQPTTGRIVLEGEDMAPLTIKERAEKIGVVLQNPNQMISKTQLFDEVALGLRIRGIDEARITERVHETLKICGLYPFRNWPISALSYGQKKRVTIASILVLEPQIIILDEPTAGQDFKHYTEMMEFLKQLNAGGMTIIMITHDMHLMLEYTQRAIVLSEGTQLADTTPSRVLTQPELIQAASLKETSLFTLANRVGIKDPLAFIEGFIKEDRRIRTSCHKQC